MNFLPFFVTLTTFFSALERPVTLFVAEAVTVKDFLTPTTLFVAASAVIGPEVTTKAEASNAEMTFLVFFDEKLLYIYMSSLKFFCVWLCSSMSLLESPLNKIVRIRSNCF